MQNVLDHEFQSFYGIGYDSNTALDNLEPNGNNGQNLILNLVVCTNILSVWFLVIYCSIEQGGWKQSYSVWIII